MPPNMMNCPQCRKPVTWEGNAFRPFCSERCRLLDLGAWADGRYRIAAGSPDAPGEDRQDPDHD